MRRRIPMSTAAQVVKYLGGREIVSRMANEAVRRGFELPLTAEVQDGDGVPLYRFSYDGREWRVADEVPRPGTCALPLVVELRDKHGREESCSIPEHMLLAAQRPQ